MSADRAFGHCPEIRKSGAEPASARARNQVPARTMCHDLGQRAPPAPYRTSRQLPRKKRACGAISLRRHYPAQVLGVAVQPQAFRPLSPPAGPDRPGLATQPRPRGLAPPLGPQAFSASPAGHRSSRASHHRDSLVPRDRFHASRLLRATQVPGRTGQDMDLWPWFPARAPAHDDRESAREGGGCDARRGE